MNISRITGIVFLIFFFVSHAVCAQEAAATDSFNYYYARNNYAKAIGFWEMFGKDCRDFELVKNAGNCYYYLNECETAISYYEKARHFIDTDDNEKQIVILMNLGTSYQQLRQFENAKKYLFAAKRLNDLKLSAITPTLMMNIGSYYHKTNLPDSAEIYNLLALKLFVNEFGESHEKTLLMYSNIGEFYQNQGEIEKALVYFTKGLAIAEVMKKNYFIFLLNYDLSFVYYKLKLWDKAIYYFNKTLSSIDENSVNYKAGIESALAYCYSRTDSKVAEAMFFASLGTTKQPDTNAYTYNLMCYGKFLENSKKNKLEAFSCYKQAFWLLCSKYGNYHVVLKDIYLLLGVSLQKLDIYDSSLYYCQRALYCRYPEIDTSDYASNPTDLHLANTWLLDLTGRKLQALNSIRQQEITPDSAFSINSLIIVNGDYYRRCLEMLLRDKTFLADQVNILREDVRRYMLMGLEACYELYSATNNHYYFEKGLEFSETGKYLLIKSMMDNKVNKQLLPYNLAIADATLNNGINNLHTQISRLQHSGQGSAHETDSLNNRLFELVLSKDSLRNVILSQFPGDLRREPVHRTLEELQSQLTDDDVLIEYFLQDSALHALYLTTSGIFWYRIHGGSKLNNAIRQVTGFCNPFEKNSISKAEYISTALYLSEVLLEAADSLNPETAHYLIVPDAALTFLPFDVLLTSPVEEGTSYSDMPYLLRDHAISYYYSAQFIPGSGPYGVNSSHDFLAIAPEFGNESSENYRQGLSPIGQAAEEAGQLHTLLGGVLLTDTSATLENFLRNVKGKDIIHFATHAELNTDNAFDSRLIFGSDVIKDEQQVLYASEICSMDLDARLAVLSSCNTGSGEILNGEGVISLAWAFQYAGCESVAMSLFPLDDGSARRIMISFYGHLKDGMTKDESLRQAKLAFISGMVPAMTHPKYWAGIIVSGDQRALFENNTRRNLIIAGCLMLVGLVVAGIIRKKKLAVGPALRREQ